MKVVDSIRCAGIAIYTIVWDIGFGKEVSSIGGRVNNGRPNDSDGTWNIRATNVRL
jgi:hypothetical protein